MSFTKVQSQKEIDKLVKQFTATQLELQAKSTAAKLGVEEGERLILKQAKPLVDPLSALAKSSAEQTGLLKDIAFGAPIGPPTQGHPLVRTVLQTIQKELEFQKVKDDDMLQTLKDISDDSFSVRTVIEKLVDSMSDDKVTFENQIQFLKNIITDTQKDTTIPKDDADKIVSSLSDTIKVVIDRKGAFDLKQRALVGEKKQLEVDISDLKRRIDVLGEKDPQRDQLAINLGNLEDDLDDVLEEIATSGLAELREISSRSTLRDEPKTPTKKPRPATSTALQFVPTNTAGVFQISSDLSDVTAEPIFASITQKKFQLRQPSKVAGNPMVGRGPKIVISPAISDILLGKVSDDKVKDVIENELNVKERNTLIKIFGKLNLESANFATRQKELFKAVIKKPQKGSGLPLQIGRGQTAGLILRQPYKINNDSMFGDLMIDTAQFQNSLKLIGRDRSGKIVIDKQADQDTFDLLNKRFSSKRTYSSKSIKLFREVVDLGHIALTPSSMKFRLLSDEQRKGIKPPKIMGGQVPREAKVVKIMSGPDELVERLGIIVGGIMAGNTSIVLKNELGEIADILLNRGILTMPQHRAIFKSYVG